MIKRLILGFFAFLMVVGLVRGFADAPGSAVGALLSLVVTVYVCWRAFPAVRADFARFLPRAHLPRLGRDREPYL
jgi:uncharacterized membrane protein required for colicin V production